ncbi:hypothetical protein ABIE41_002132 [Bosea sp. OAE506]|uniref:hypothetical protein n=1 Tax=Bosea sp. OAE506 TaxID=2663870 RepID=UPI00178BDD88
MPAITYYVALPIMMGEEGDLLPGEPVEALNAWQAKSRAAGLAIHHAGAIAFSRCGDPMSGEFEPAVVIATFGSIPTNLSDLMGSAS